jgi:hypothetical protein
MSGQRSGGSEGTAESVAAGCSQREGPPSRSSRSSGGGRPLDQDGLAVFTFGRGEDGQLGLGDTSDQAEPQQIASDFVALRIVLPPGQGLMSDSLFFVYCRWILCEELEFVKLRVGRDTRLYSLPMEKCSHGVSSRCKFEALDIHISLSIFYLLSVF